MKNVWKNEFASWGVISAVIFTLYLTGLHTEVAGRMQQAFLSTGLISPAVKDISSQALNPTQQASYDIPLTKLNGEKTNIAKFAGKVVFVNLWATWCPPCIAEMPSIQKLYKQVDTTQVKFVMISLDEEPEKAKKFIARKEYTFPVYRLQQEVPADFATSSIPTTFVIAPNGKIVMRKEGMAKYNTADFKEFLVQLSKSQYSK
jgi:thiol-disulfide isomerase/thioredoxin